MRIVSRGRVSPPVDLSSSCAHSVFFLLGLPKHDGKNPPTQLLQEKRNNTTCNLGKRKNSPNLLVPNRHCLFCHCHLPCIFVRSVQKKNCKFQQRRSGQMHAVVLPHRFMSFIRGPNCFCRHNSRSAEHGVVFLSFEAVH